ncbi:hypothetical protein KM043_008508 [Ampulex compressa]|nr:hypothetical protein KM043_008508 [Ampulex compressa]
MYGISCTAKDCDQNAHTAAQRKFYQWVLRWINDNSFVEPRNPDAPTFACFLQAIGFKLVSFEKQNDLAAEESPVKREIRPGFLRIAIECGSSGMRAVLEQNEVNCRCPNPDLKDASFWSISGTAPTGSIDNIAKSIEETGSNLLPQISKDLSKVLRDVSYRLFETIGTEQDINHNTDVDLNFSGIKNSSYERNSTLEEGKKEFAVKRSHTQPEMRPKNDDPNSKNNSTNYEEKSMTSNTPTSRGTAPKFFRKPPFQRQTTWEIDIEKASPDEEPRPLPPKITSSPAMLAQLFTSLEQISLQGDIQVPRSAIEHLMGAHQNLEKALKMLFVVKPQIQNDHSTKPDQVTESTEIISEPEIVDTPTPNEPMSHIKPPSQIKCLAITEQSSTEKINKVGSVQTSKIRRSMNLNLSKPLTRRSLHVDTASLKAVQRRSLYTPPSISPNTPSTLKPPSSLSLQKIRGSTDISNAKTPPQNMSRSPAVINKPVLSESQQNSVSQIPKNMSMSISGLTSMLKPPTKMSIAAATSIKSKVARSTRANTSTATRSKSNL